jgi:hypothetical protein
LGDVRGYKPTIHLYGIDADVRLARVVEDIASKVSGMIIVQEDPSAAANVTTAARTLASVTRSVPTAVLGGDALARDWTKTTGAAPVYTATISDETFTSALKAVSKEILASLR